MTSYIILPIGGWKYVKCHQRWAVEICLLLEHLILETRASPKTMVTRIRTVSRAGRSRWAVRSAGFYRDKALAWTVFCIFD